MTYPWINVSVQLRDGTWARRPDVRSQADYLELAEFVAELLEEEDADGNAAPATR